ncbi:MAG: radical SAM protein [Desulfobacterales bacterium]|nr:radical SAM protein [Desulfobacterales bacterium]
MQRKRTVTFSSNATNIFFHILTQCNLKCRHCYINPEQHGNQKLTLQTIREWLAIFAKKNKNANVIFLGGEPTLHPDLAPAIKEARQLGYSSITVDTNGYLFHDIIDNVTPDDVDYFSFSLDGATPEVNDPLRGVGSYDACTKGVRTAVSKGFDASMIFTVSRENIHDLMNMPLLLNKLGIKRFFIQIIGIRGNPAKTGADSWQVTKDEWLETVPKVAEAAAQIGITVTYPKVYLPDDEKFECAGLVADNYFIFPNSRVYRCPLCEDFPIHNMELRGNKLVERKKINEMDLFRLDIPEGCVMNKIIQPDNIIYKEDGTPLCKVACCLLKEEITPA